MTQDRPRAHPLDSLSDQDREFVLRLVLASGSLKDLAKYYGVMVWMLMMLEQWFRAHEDAKVRA